MGMKVTPNYASIFMHHMECGFLLSYKIKQFYKCSLDDILFMVLSHSENKLLKFIEALSQAHPSSFFTHSYSDVEINVLDVQVWIEHNALVASIYRKPTDRHSTCAPTSATRATVRPAFLILRHTDSEEYGRAQKTSTKAPCGYLKYLSIKNAHSLSKVPTVCH